MFLQGESVGKCEEMLRFVFFFFFFKLNYLKLVGGGKAGLEDSSPVKNMVFFLQSLLIAIIQAFSPYSSCVGESTPVQATNRKK